MNKIRLIAIDQNDKMLFEHERGSMSKKQVPSVGRVVHYFAYGSPHGEFPAEVARAAIITEVDEPDNPESAVGLCVLNPSGIFLNQHIPHATVKMAQTGRKSGAWDWPPYVPPIEVDDNA